MDGRNAGGQALSKKLYQEHRHEAAEHRRILFERGSGLSPSWKDFRTFLHDLGPAPSDEHLATRLMSGDPHSQWLVVQGVQIEFTDLARALGVPFEAMAVALRSGVTPDQLVQQAS